MYADIHVEAKRLQTYMLVLNDIIDEHGTEHFIHIFTMPSRIKRLPTCRFQVWLLYVFKIVDGKSTIGIDTSSGAQSNVFEVTCGQQAVMQQRFKYNVNKFASNAQIIYSIFSCPGSKARHIRVIPIAG